MLRRLVYAVVLILTHAMISAKLILNVCLKAVYLVGFIQSSPSETKTEITVGNEFWCSTEREERASNRDFLFDISSNDEYMSETDESDRDSVVACKEKTCDCEADLAHLFTTDTSQGGLPGCGSAITRLNRLSRNLIACQEGHSQVWYLVLLFNYREMETSLSKCVTKTTTSKQGSRDGGGEISTGIWFNECSRADVREIFLDSFMALLALKSFMRLKFDSGDNKFSGLDLLDNFVSKLCTRFQSQLRESTFMANSLWPSG